MPLDTYITRCLNQILTRNAEGQLPYSLILWSDVKKSAKSCVAAAVALWQAWNTPWGSIKVVANDLKQADSRVSYYIRRAIELNPDMREIVKIKPSGYKIEFPNHCMIEAIPVDPKGEAGGNDDGVYYSELWGAANKAALKLWCFDEETEILTKRGWVFGGELIDEDIVASYNPDTDNIDWEKPREIFKSRYDGEMHLYESASFSHCVTPEHRLYGIFSYNGKGGSVVSGKRYNYSKQGVMRSNELRSSGYSVFQPKVAMFGWKPESEPEFKIVDKTSAKPAVRIKWSDWCEFMGWYTSEGNVKRNDGKPYTIIITQEPKVNPEKCQKIKECLTRCFGETGFSWHGSTFRIHNATLAGELAHMSGSYEKYVPEDIKNSSKENLKLFADAFILGDGTRGCGKESKVLYTCSKRMADDLMEIGIKLGHTVSTTSNVSKRNGTIMYRVLYAEGKDGYTRWLQKNPKKNRDGHWKSIDYSGLVWCPSVTTGLIITRRHGKVCISGNTETTLSPTKFGQSFRWVETYAGYSGEAPLLEHLYEQGVKQGRKFDWTTEFEPELDAFENESGRMFCLWNTHPRRPWQTKEYYGQEEATLTPTEFDRVHKNQWVTSMSSFVPIEWWDNCRADMQPLDAEEPMIMSVDAAVSGDSFAVVCVSGRGNPLTPETDVRYAKAWRPPKGGKIDFTAPEMEIRRLIAEFNVMELTYDEYQLADMAGRLKRELVVHMCPFPQGGARLKADKLLYDMIREKRVHHDGDYNLREHVLNANSKEEGDNRMRIVKRSDEMKIDLCVALSMANDRCRYWRL